MSMSVKMSKVMSMAAGTQLAPSIIPVTLLNIVSSAHEIGATRAIEVIADNEGTKLIGHFEVSKLRLSLLDLQEFH